jgi:hypothetical protein
VLEQNKIVKSRVPAGIQTGNVGMLVTYPRHWTCVTVTIVTVSVVITAGYGNMYKVAHFSGTTNAWGIGSLLHPFRPWNHSLILGYGHPQRCARFYSTPFLAVSFSPVGCPFPPAPLCHTVTIGHFVCCITVNVNVQKCAVREHWVSRWAVDRCNVRSRSTNRWQQIQHQATVCTHVS